MTAAAVPHTAIAITIDVGEANNIHPKNKQEVGRRLGLLVLEQVYKQPVKSSGPLFARMQIEGAAIRVSHACRELGSEGWRPQGVCHRR